MATDKSENTDGGARGDEGSQSMKDRLLAQRRADAANAGAPPVPASKPVMRPAASAAPATSAPRSAAPARPQAAAAPAAPADEAKRPVKLRAQRADEQDERRARRGDKQVSPEVLREVQMLRKQQDKWITYGWIVAGGLLAVAGIVFLIVTHNRDKLIAIQEAYDAKINGEVHQLEALDLKSEKGAHDALKLIEDFKEDWSTTDLEGVKIKFTQAYQTAIATIDHFKEVKDLLDGLAIVEKSVQNAATMKPEELNQVRRNLLSYKQRGSELGTEFLAKVADLKQKVNRVYAERLHEDAKAAAAKGPGEARAALTAYKTDEDNLIDLLDEAAQEKMADAKKAYEDLLQAMIAESDALVAQVFTPEVIEKTPWTDLLNGEQAKNWVPSDGFKGFEVNGGTLHAVALDPGAKRQGVASVGDREKWRDYVVETEFTIVKGSFDVLYRLGKAVNNTTYKLNVSSSGNNAFKAGQSYTMTTSVLGSHIKITFSDAEKLPNDDDLRWTIRRNGAIGISLPEGSDVKFTKMRIRVLR